MSRTTERNYYRSEDGNRPIRWCAPVWKFSEISLKIPRRHWNMALLIPRQMYMHMVSHCGSFLAMEKFHIWSWTIEPLFRRFWREQDLVYLKVERRWCYMNLHYRLSCWSVWNHGILLECEFWRETYVWRIGNEVYEVKNSRRKRSSRTDARYTYSIVQCIK